MKLGTGVEGQDRYNSTLLFLPGREGAARAGMQSGEVGGGVGGRCRPQGETVGTYGTTWSTARLSVVLGVSISDAWVQPGG